MRRIYPINEEKRLTDSLKDGMDYVPFIRHTDFASDGNVIRARGTVIPRVYSLFSNLEYGHFLLLDSDPLVTDLKEQYPLWPKSQTILIAEKLGVPHPKNPDTGEPVMMTTDLLAARTENGASFLTAYDVKPFDKAQNGRVRNKRRIEEEYWKLKGVELRLMTERELDRTMQANLKILRSVEKPDNELLLETFRERLNKTELRVKDFLSAFDEEFNLPRGTGLHYLEWLVKDGQEVIDLRKHIHKKEVQNAYWKHISQHV